LDLATSGVGPLRWRIERLTSKNLLERASVLLL
jgi:hypothetical protein